MRLDRNTNRDGTQKYALVHMRRVRELAAAAGTPLSSVVDIDVQAALATLKAAGVLSYGNESPQAQFFVVKHGDRFASWALKGYERGVRVFASSQPHGSELKESLTQYADDVAAEAQLASMAATKLPD